MTTVEKTKQEPLGQFSLDLLATELRVDKAALTRTADRLGLVRNGSQIDLKAKSELVLQYAQKKGKRSDATVNAAKRIAQSMGIYDESKATSKVLKKTSTATLVATKKSSTRKTEKKEASGIEAFLKSKNFLLGVFICALLWQVFHTAGVVGRMDVDQHFTSNYAFALAIQFTALLMTIHGGSVRYLYGFAVIEFLFNMAYYEPWADGGKSIMVWSINILISATIAFTIFCYSKLLTDK